MTAHVCAPIDANGNLTSDGTKTYFWNALHQLVEVNESTTTIATFEYDGEGRRTEKVAAGLTHQYIYGAEDIRARDGRINRGRCHRWANSNVCADRVDGRTARMCSH